MTRTPRRVGSVTPMATSTSTKEVLEKAPAPAVTAEPVTQPMAEIYRAASSQMTALVDPANPRNSAVSSFGNQRSSIVGDPTNNRLSMINPDQFVPEEFELMAPSYPSNEGR